MVISSISDESTIIAIVVSVLGFLGVMITQWTMFCVAHMHQKRNVKRLETTERQLGEINDAVNNRHEKDPSGKKLYDLALENHQRVIELTKWKEETKQVIREIREEIKKVVKV